jgi:hypothetical protein
MSVSRTTITITTIAEKNLHDLLLAVTDWLDRRAGPQSEIKGVRFATEGSSKVAYITEQEEA